jgi:hypothetical protein
MWERAVDEEEEEEEEERTGRVEDKKALLLLVLGRCRDCEAGDFEGRDPPLLLCLPGLLGHSLALPPPRST